MKTAIKQDATRKRRYSTIPGKAAYYAAFRAKRWRRHYFGL